jgi:hypothetical protein
MVLVQTRLQETDLKNSGKWNRYNLGAYFDVAYVTEDFLINGTLRHEGI